MEEYKQINTEENYNKLLNSGMFWEFHPELTGMWEVDKKLILPVVSNRRELLLDYEKWLNEYPKLKDREKQVDKYLKK